MDLRDDADDRPGDAACWLASVCRDCGAFVEDTACPDCGAVQPERF